MTFPFDSEEALQRWLSSRSLGHLSQVSLSTLAPQIEPAFQPQARNVLSRLRMVEVLHQEGLTRWIAERGPGNRLRRVVPELARRYVESEHADLLASRREEKSRLAAPSHPVAARLHAALLSLREQLPGDLAPRTDARLARLELSLPTEPPGFLIKEVERSELPSGARFGFILPEVRLTIEAGAVTHRCSCGLDTCVHLLAAIDAILLRLQSTPDPLWTERLEAMLQRPWQRALQAMERAVSAAAGAQGLSWRLDVIEGFGVEVFPYVHRAGRGGRLSAGARVSRRRLLQDHAELMTADDARIASLLPEGTVPASHALLLALVDHPGLVMDEAPELNVRVERAQVGVVAVSRGDGLALSVGVDGTPLPDALLDRLRKRPPEEGQFLWEPGRRILTVLEVPRAVRALLPVLHQHPEPFPPESHAALLEQLTAMAGRSVPVSLPQHAMGEAVPPEQRPVLRFEAQPGGAVRLELRLRAIANGPLHLPGEGPRDVHARVDGRTVHAVRDLAREREVARALAAELPLRHAEEDPAQDFVYRFTSPLGALELLHAAKELEAPPEVEWAEGPPHVAPSPGLGALKVVLERKREWFGVMGGLSVHGERVELARLLEATRRGERFVPIGARGYLELEGALLAQLERLADHVHTSRHGLELGPSAAQALAELEDGGAQVEADAHWRGLVERIFAAKELDPPLPPGLHATLRGYQHDGFRWLMRLASWGAGGVLADDMGLGKTVQSLAVLLARASLGPQLVLAPSSVAFNWVEEAERFAPSLRLHLYGEAVDRGGLLAALGPGDVLVLSYGLLTRDRARLAGPRFSTIVFDEAQSLKNALTQRFRAARALQGDFRFALSGTPLENDLGELWSLFALVFPTLLGSREAFRKRYAAPIERKVDPTAGPALARVLQPFLLRRTKGQVERELPSRTELTVPVVLSAEEWSIYEDARLAALSDFQVHKPQLKEQEKRILILSALTRLRLLASHPRLGDPTSTVASAKLHRALQLIEELIGGGQRALVFSQFTSHLSLLREALDARGIPYVYLDGQTPQKLRAERVQRFQEGDAPLFLISLKAGGFGLNLTAASSVLHLDPWWNPAVEDQASDRAHRLGQTRPVTIYRLVAKGTIEEQMLSLHRHKRELVEGVLEGKDAAARLSTPELLGMLAQQVIPEQGRMESPEPTRH